MSKSRRSFARKKDIKNIPEITKDNEENYTKPSESVNNNNVFYNEHIDTFKSEAKEKGDKILKKPSSKATKKIRDIVRENREIEEKNNKIRADILTSNRGFGGRRNKKRSTKKRRK